MKGTTCGGVPFRAAWLALVLVGIFLLTAAVPAQAQGDTVTLPESVTGALAYSPRLQVLKANRQAVGFERDRARGGYYPAIDVGLGYGAEAHSDEYTRSRDDEHDFSDRSEASIRLSQLVFDGREVGSRVGIEEARLVSADYRVLDNAESVALDAVIAHLEVYRQGQLVLLAEQNLKDHQNILNMLSDRQKGGVGSIADVDQTRGRLARAQATLAETRAGLRAAEANYLRLVGKVPGQPEFYMVPPNVVPADLDAALQATAAGNPKVLALGANVDEARQQVALSRSSFWPKIYAELSSSYYDNVESSETYEHNNLAILRLRWNLLNGGSDLADRRASSARKQQAMASRDDQRDTVLEETRATWAELGAIRQQVVAYGDAINYNQKTLDSYLKQFNVGQRTLLDVLDARNELFQSSGLLVTSKVNEVIAVERLLALGGKLNETLQVDTRLYSTGGM